MVRKCIVPGCSATYDKEFREKKLKGEKCPSTFTCPNETLLPQWKAKIPRKDFEITMTSPVCARHFHPNDIITHDIINLPDGTKHMHERGRPILRKDAVPKVFDGPKYLSEQPKNKRPPPKQRSRVLAQKRSAMSGQTDEIPPKSPRLKLNANEDNEQEQTEAPVNEDTSEISMTHEENEEHIMTQDIFSAQSIHEKCHQFKLPGHFWGVHSDKASRTAFAFLDCKMEAVKIILFTSSLKPQVYIRKVEKDFPEVNTQKDLENLLRRVEAIRLCEGHTDIGVRNPGWSSKCTGSIADAMPRSTQRCLACSQLRRSLKKKRKSQTTDFDRIKKKQQFARKLKTKAQKVSRLTKKVMTLQQKMRSVKREMTKLSQSKIEDIVSSLPKEQQELVRTCFKPAKTQKNGMRYSREWVYECLLMKIMAPKLYRKLYRENKMPLPSTVTLNRYLKKIRPAYGFQESTFNLLKEKKEQFSEDERHGCLLIDEMALDDAVSYIKELSEIHGLVDLGKHTPEADKTKRGDHALVIMYQPFKGKWVQAIGAFLSSGATKGNVLQHIVLEALILLENSGFHVDCVTTDGATWNRCMWECFGISKQSHCCEHPVDENRKLFFASDFPHLMKNLWSRITNNKILNFPFGQVKLSHWRAVLERDKNKGIKRAFTLTEDMLDPTTYQKMNVRMAMRFFGHTLGTAMQSYREEEHPDLDDSEPTIKFILMMNEVVEAMNSQTPQEALRPDPASKHYQVLTNFLTLLETLNQEAKARRIRERTKKASQKKKKATQKRMDQDEEEDDNEVYVGGAPFELTASTFLGLVVTIKTALGLVEYLHDELQYSYFLTRRINQDALEHFFGMIRGSCGSSNHPDPLLFIQVYRLLSIYSLIKPPRGSNVSGGEMLEALLKIQDLETTDDDKKKKEIEEKIDIILDGGFQIDDVLHVTDHNYVDKPIDDLALSVFGGYVSRKLRKMMPARECDACFDQLCMPATEKEQDRERLLHLRTYGGLLRPSDDMFTLLYQLEEAVLKVTASTPIHSNLFFDVLDALVCSPSVPHIGCEKHERQLTSAAITFFLTCRMHFICREANQSVLDKRRKKKNMAKLAKQGTGSQHKD